MTLTAGSRVGPYEVVAALGAGGMGVVYRARDTQLKRDVALKVLPAEVAADPHRLARFQREAELLAALNHPHIAQIYGLAETEGVPALVMELVEGPTLAERIARGPLPLDEAMPIAIELAEALEYAHEHSIIHRDLKPANIKLTPDGAVKVLDFGLAKALEAGAPGDPAESPTLTSPAITRAGVILGTAAYMAPEQARGVAVDKRADIWTFGVVLYEMLTGTACFSGDTVTDVLLAVVRSEPNWNALPAETPAVIRRLLHRCLAKDRKQRVHDIADARLEMEQARVPGEPGGVQPSAVQDAGMAAASRRFRVFALVLVSLAVLALTAASVAYWLTTRPPAPGPVVHVDLALPDGHALVASPAISPDGRTVAFVTQGPSGRPHLYIRHLMDDFDVREIPGTEEADQPFFSPDGRSVAFFAKRQLFRVRLDGGAPVAIASAPNPRGGTWGDDDSIVFAPDTSAGLLRLTAGRGKPQLLIRPDGNTNYGFVNPRFLPGARELLFSVWGKEEGPAHLNLATLERSNIVSGFTTNAVYAVSGHVVFGGRQNQEGEILAVAETAHRQGSPRVPVSVQQNVFRTVRSATSWFDLSRNGTLVYAVADISRNTLVKVDQTGRVVATLMGDRTYYDAKPTLSPDGTRITYAKLGRIRVRNLERGTDDLLSTEDGVGTSWDDRAPVWTPDGGRVVFASNRTGSWDLFARNASGGGGADPVVQEPLNQINPAIRSQDGTIAFLQSNPGAGYDIWFLPPGGKSEAALATPANEVSPSFSADGRLVAYTSDESGRPETYVTPFARPLKRGVIASAEGGICPAWSPKQNRLFFWQGMKMMAVDVRPDGSPAGSPRMLFDAGWSLGAPGGIIRPTIGTTTCFDVMPDGEHFLMVRADPEAIPTRLHLIFNWFEELKARVPR